ncbi:MAG: hypothetical protein RQ745_08750 [Longimicrobiales bacterium]|nr:hypothetical protein [Longimicrobiales bacterium]
MSLLAFHRFLIATAILFCGGYAVREITAALRGAGTGALVVGAVFALLTVALVVYLVRLRHFLGYDREEPSAR